MARSDGAPAFSKRLLCSELTTRCSILVEGRWCRVTRVERIYRKIYQPGRAKPISKHIRTDVYTNHPDYGSWEPSAARLPGSKITVQFWLTSEVWEERKK